MIGELEYSAMLTLRDRSAARIRRNARAALRRFNKRHPRVSPGVRRLMVDVLNEATENMTYEQAYRIAIRAERGGA